jgi:hypothetical protein
VREIAIAGWLGSWGASVEEPSDLWNRVPSSFLCDPRLARPTGPYLGRNPAMDYFIPGWTLFGFTAQRAVTP